MQSQTQLRSQVYDGYVENGFFYPKAALSRLQGRFKAVLTVIDVPTTEPEQEDNSTDWLDEFVRMVKEDTSDKLRMEDFPRLDFGREPIIFNDEE